MKRILIHRYFIRVSVLGLMLAVASVGMYVPQVHGQTSTKKPNILVIWGDDIGTWNTSFWSRGMMGYLTPNIDRIAKEGVAFTDYYAQQSCTAGRAAFIGGNVPVRTGMTKVGLPGAKEGWQKTDSNDGHRNEKPRLCHRPVRQEPSGRS